MTAAAHQGGCCWWDPERGWSPSIDGAGTVQVIDSWLVDEGRVRGLDRHAGRFCAACERFSGPGAQQTYQFLRAVAESLPVRGRWFPRVELVTTGARTRLRLWLRLAPPLNRTVRLWMATEPDRRQAPGTKGRDLDYLASLRATAAKRGADEALLVSPQGRVLEGASTSIVWWRAETLCVPPLGPLLPGITRTLLCELARAAGHPIVIESPTVSDLASVPVWTLNALHGIRPVTEGMGRFVEAHAPVAERWQRRLEALAVPICADLIPNPSLA